MRTAALTALVTISAAAATAGAAIVAKTPQPASIESWEGPIAGGLDAMSTGLDGVGYVMDGSDALPAGTPFDSLSIVKHTEPRPGLTAYDERYYRLAVHTAAGWFESPILGVGANRWNCSVEKVAAAGARMLINYSCEAGRFDRADKSFIMLCGADPTGRPVCARQVLTATYNVHTGDKSEHQTDTTYDTLSCAATNTGDTIALAPLPVKRDPDTATYHEILALEPCAAPVTLDVRTARPPVVHAPPLFDEAGAWEPWDLSSK